ncbi:hypothetical protein NMY22_g1628 [Coprinellus aureogranulatus]|nr:hypothetical protein NMY22_g1628 [Coprinellus aureogranulatus]
MQGTAGMFGHPFYAQAVQAYANRWARIWYTTQTHCEDQMVSADHATQYGSPLYAQGLGLSPVNTPAQDNDYLNDIDHDYHIQTYLSPVTVSPNLGLPTPNTFDQVPNARPADGSSNVHSAANTPWDVDGTALPPGPPSTGTLSPTTGPPTPGTPWDFGFDPVHDNAKGFTPSYTLPSSSAPIPQGCYDPSSSFDFGAYPNNPMADTHALSPAESAYIEPLSPPQQPVYPVSPPNALSPTPAPLSPESGFEFAAVPENNTLPSHPQYPPPDSVPQASSYDPSSAFAFAPYVDNPLAVDHIQNLVAVQPTYTQPLPPPQSPVDTQDPSYPQLAYTYTQSDFDGPLHAATAAMIPGNTAIESAYPPGMTELLAIEKAIDSFDWHDAISMNDTQPETVLDPTNLSLPHTAEVQSNRYMDVNMCPSPIDEPLNIAGPSTKRRREEEEDSVEPAAKKAEGCGSRGQQEKERRQAQEEVGEARRETQEWKGGGNPVARCGAAITCSDPVISAAGKQAGAKVSCNRGDKQRRQKERNIIELNIGKPRPDYTEVTKGLKTLAEVRDLLQKQQVCLHVNKDGEICGIPYKNGSQEGTYNYREVHNSNHHYKCCHPANTSGTGTSSITCPEPGCGDRVDCWGFDKHMNKIRHILGDIRYLRLVCPESNCDRKINHFVPGTWWFERELLQHDTQCSRKGKPEKKTGIEPASFLWKVVDEEPNLNDYKV